MVRITNAFQRQSEKGPFVVLELTGDLEMVQSVNTLRFYATVRKATVSTTVDLETAQLFIGRQMPGRIVKTPSEPYEFTIPETGEVITFSHRWEFAPYEEAPVYKMEVEKGRKAA